MKKRLYLITAILASVTVLSLSSCLKDPRYLDFSKVGTLVEFPLGGTQNFAADAITAAPGDDANGSITVQFAVNVASPTVPTTATTVTLAIDNSIITSYNALGGPVTYVPLPTSDFSFTTTTVNIPAGQRSGIASVTFYKNLMDPTQSYMLPIKIVSTTGGYTISGNFNIHYFHFIGNAFAATDYVWDYYRYNSNTVLPTPSAGTSLGQQGTISPVTPTEFTMLTGYNGSGVYYIVDFDIAGTGPSTVYSNFTVSFDAATVAAGWTPAGITTVDGPNILIANPTTKEFKMQYIDFNGTADRYIIDDYHH
jgi:hypothetical protein